MSPTLVRRLIVVGLLAFLLRDAVGGKAHDGPNLPGPTKVPRVAFEPRRPVELETDAAFAGTWQLVQKSGTKGNTQVGDRIVVEERFGDLPPYVGVSSWVWHEDAPSPQLLTQRTSYTNWGPTRTPGDPWPVIEMSRGPLRRPPVKAIYLLRGENLWLSFETARGELPDSFAMDNQHDVEVWQRVAPPRVAPEPEARFDGRWKLESVEFRTSGSSGPAANTNVPAHLAGTTRPDWFLVSKVGTIFEVKNGTWRVEDGKEGDPTWTTHRELRIPGQAYLRRLPEPRPPGVPAEERATYQLGLGVLTLSFPQIWMARHADGEIYLDAGTRVETYYQLTGKTSR